MASSSSGGEVTASFLPAINTGSDKIPNKAPQLHSYSPRSYTSLQLPFLPVATKAEKYAQLTAFDQSGLKRQKAHVRNALKTTDPLENVARQLDLRLSKIEQGGSSKISFERLSAYRGAFEEIIKLTTVFSPLLQRIKDAYNSHLLLVLSQHPESSDQQTHQPAPSFPPPSTNNDPLIELKDLEGEGELLRMRKQLHQLEVEARVLIHENERLREDLMREADTHEKKMAMIQLPSDDDVPVIVSTSTDYASKVEEIQLKIAEERSAIADLASRRKGRIPLTVCHHLEQCIREVEIEVQKAQRRSKNLSQDIKKTESQLYSTFKAHGYKLESDDLASILDLS